MLVFHSLLLGDLFAQVTNTNANARLLTLEGNMNNLQPTGQVATQLTTLGSRLTTLEARVSDVQIELRNRPRPALMGETRAFFF